MKKRLTFVSSMLASLVIFVVSACATSPGMPVSEISAAKVQETNPSQSADILLGEWRGRWRSNSGMASNALAITLSKINEREAHGRVRFTTSNSPPCSSTWMDFIGEVNGEIVFAVNLGGRCGKIEVTFSIVEKGQTLVMAGVYSVQYPDRGTIRLTKQ